MREHIRAFCRLFAEVFEPSGPVYEFGAYQVAGQEELGNLRALFEGKEFVGCDQRAGAGVERIEDLAALRLADESVPTALCFETLEHVFEIEAAVGELQRVLVPGGLLVVSMPFALRIHGHPSDYWRVTPVGLARLLGGFGGRLIGAAGWERFPHTVLGVAVRAPVPDDFAVEARRLASKYQAWLAGVSRAVGWRRRLEWYRDWVLGDRLAREQLRAWYEASFVLDVPASAVTASVEQRRSPIDGATLT